MAIDSVTSAASSGIAQLQTRSFQPGAQSGTDNNAVKDFLQESQASAQTASPPSPAEAQQAAPARTVLKAPEENPANSDAGSSAGQSVKDLIEARRNEPGPNEASPNRGTATQPTQTSALNYSASGSANAAQNPTSAGKLVSLSV